MRRYRNERQNGSDPVTQRPSDPVHLVTWPLDHFLLAVLFAVVVLAGCGEREGGPKSKFDNPEQGDMGYWQNPTFIPDTTDKEGKKGRWSGYFVQENVDGTKLSQGIIRARVDGKWQEYKVVTLPDGFLDWNFKSRLKQLAEYRELVTSKVMRMPTLSGPHNGIVASHGAKRRDSYFTVNNAVKGMGWLPRQEKLTEVAELLKRTWDSPLPVKLAILESLYQHGKENFDLTKQTSLELYARPDFETHTFLNQMTDPGVAIVFLDLPTSYELRCIAQMLHPENPNLTDNERQIVEYVNLVHDYFHGRAPRQATAVVYQVVQVFDNSPPRGAGRRVAP